jgi:predicted Zn-dependent peptidase
MDPRDVRLASGLPLVIAPLHHVHRAVATLYLRVGSRFETQENNGLSHFLEHMVFRGTPSMPSAHDQALAFERLGATLYAATHVDHGVMSVSVPPSNLETILERLGEVTTSPRLGEIEIERGIVREELLEDLDEDGRDIDADNRCRALIYPDHPLGMPIAGSLKTLERFNEPMLRAHHAKHYTTENAVLCVAGRIDDEAKIIAAAERAFASMPKGARTEIAPAPPMQRKARFELVENQSSQTELRLAFRAASERDPEEAAVEMLLRVLDDGMSTRLYERICDRLGLCYDVSAMFECYEDDGVFDIGAGVDHARATTVTKEIFSLLSDLAAHGPTDAELDKAKQRHAWDVEGMLDDASGTAEFYGLSALANIARSPRVRHAELEAVTKERVRAAAERTFRPEQLVVVAVGMLSRAEEQKLERAVRAFG